MDVRRIFTIAMLVLGFSTAHSQTSCYIKGTVKDSSGLALAGASIRFWDFRDTVDLLSNFDGSFNLHGQFDKYVQVMVTMKGYKVYQTGFHIPINTKEYSLPTIFLQLEYQELQSAFVIHLTPIRLKTDTIQYNAVAYSMREGAMLADLMQKLPGIYVNSDSSIIVMGKKVSKVLLDGKEFYGGNVQTALQNLPYDIIDKVEIIDDYGDQARLSGIKRGSPEKVLNIELKKDKRNGQLGSAQGGFGNEDQYSATLVANTFCGERKISVIGGAINNNLFGKEATQFVNSSYADRYSDVWTGLGDGSFSSDHHRFLNSSIQDYHLAGGLTHQQQDNITQGNRQQQQLNYECRYRSTNNNELRISTSFIKQLSNEINQINLTSSEFDSGFRETTHAIAFDQLSNRDIDGESKISFAQSFPSVGHRLTLDADLKYLSNQQLGDNLTTTQLQIDSLRNSTIQHYKLDNSSRGLNIFANLHYYIPLGSKGLLEGGYSLRYTHNKSSRKWLQPDSNGKNWNTVDSISNLYSFRTVLQDWRIGYSRHSYKTDFVMAMIAEPGNLEGISHDWSNKQSYNYFNLTPAGSFSYSLDKGKKVMLGYSTTVSAPLLQQVQPVTDLSNPQYPVTGNPNLKPMVTQSISVNYDQNSIHPNRYQGFSIGIGYSATKGQVITNIVHPRDTSGVIQKTSFENVNGTNGLSLNWRFDLPAYLQKRLKITGSGSFGDNNDFSMIDHILYATRMLNTAQALNLQYSIPNQLDISTYISYSYSITHYNLRDIAAVSATSLFWGMNNRHYLLRNLVLSYEFTESINSGIAGGPSPNPVLLNIHLQRYALKNKRAIFSLSVNNIFNSNANINQSITPTVITQNSAHFLGRTILFNVKWNFERFKKLESKSDRKIINPTEEF